jgi:hypothetical protein
MPLMLGLIAGSAAFSLIVFGGEDADEKAETR